MNAYLTKDSLAYQQHSGKTDLFRLPNAKRGSLLDRNSLGLNFPHPAKQFKTPKNDDEVFERLLVYRGPRTLLEELSAVVTGLAADTVRLSKNTLLRLVRKLCKQNCPPEGTPFKKSGSPLLEKTYPVSLEFLEREKDIAIKNLINEKFESSFGDIETPKGGRGAAHTIQKLFQKEALFEQSLNLLSEDNVDLNQLLFCAFERIQSENFDVPKEAARFLDGDFQFEDRLQMPRSKWLTDSQIAQQMRIELANLAVLEGNEN